MFIVKLNEKSYVCSTYLGTTGVPVFEWCKRENDAHLFDSRAAAEAIAFLVGGEVVLTCP